MSGSPAIRATVTCVAGVRRSSERSTSSRYSPGSRRSTRRTLGSPKTSSFVPRRRFIPRNVLNAGTNQRPSLSLRSMPSARSSGGGSRNFPFGPGAERLLALRALDGVEVQPRDLVLVLVGHQLVQAARVVLGDGGLARRAAAALLRGDPHDVLGVAPRVRRVLVADEVRDAHLEQPAQLALGARGVD